MRLGSVAKKGTMHSAALPLHVLSSQIPLGICTVLGGPSHWMFLNKVRHASLLQGEVLETNWTCTVNCRFTNKASGLVYRKQCLAYWAALGMFDKCREHEYH